MGIFEGKFPCDGCERLKTALVFLQDPVTQASAGYRLREVYVGQSDLPRDTQGSWRIVRGTPSDPDAVVYELDPDDSETLIFYLKVQDDILLLLDENLRTRVGDASLSFTLSRTK